MPRNERTDAERGRAAKPSASAPEDLPRAIKEGSILDGLVPTYLLPDGDELISGRGAVLALTALNAPNRDTAKRADLGRFLDRPLALARLGKDLPEDVCVARQHAATAAQLAP